MANSFSRKISAAHCMFIDVSRSCATKKDRLFDRCKSHFQMSVLRFRKPACTRFRSFPIFHVDFPRKLN